MNSTPVITPQHPKWPVKLIAALVFMMILGFTPWEPLLSIQIRDSTLTLLTSVTMGLGGSIGLTCTVLICIRRNYKRFSLPATILLSCLLIPMALMLILSLV